LSKIAIVCCESFQEEKLDLLLAADRRLYDTFKELLLSRIRNQFGKQRMADEVAALRCMRRAATKACKLRYVKGYNLPLPFRPYSSDAYGLYPQIIDDVNVNRDGDLAEVCRRMCYTEIFYLEHLRKKQSQRC
jgi:hypothetical protein